MYTWYQAPGTECEEVVEGEEEYEEEGEREVGEEEEEEGVVMTMSTVSGAALSYPPRREYSSV